jgi:hypothetical protein
MRHVSFASNNVQTERKNTNSTARFLHENPTKGVEQRPHQRLFYNRYNATLRIRLSSEAKLLAKCLRRRSIRRCAVLMNVFLRAWRRLGRAQELVGIVGGMLAILAACVAGFHAGYMLHLTHTHEVVTSCRPVGNDYAFTGLDLSSPPERCRMHDEPGHPLLFRFVVLDGMIFFIAGLAAIEGLRPIVASRADFEEA